MLIVSIIISGVAIAMMPKVPEDVVKKSDLEGLATQSDLNSLRDRISGLEEGQATILEELGAETPPRLSVTSINVPSEARVGQTVDVSAIVTNTGGQEGSETIDFIVDGETMDSQDVTVGPGETKTVTFQITKDEEGTYNLNIGGASATLTVSPKKTEIEKIKIGAVFPLTGDFSAFGEECLDAEKIGVKHVNEAGGVQSLGGAKFELVIEDDESTTEGAKLAAERMINIHNVPVVTGVFISGHVLAMQPIIEGEAIFFPNAMSDKITQRGFEYTYRMMPTASDGAKIAAEMVSDLQEKYGSPDNPIEDIAILNEDSTFGTYAGIGFEEAAGERGWNILFHEECGRDIKDVSSIMNKIHEENPDIVFHAPYYTDSILFARAVNDLGPGCKFWAGANETGFTDARSLADLGADANYFTNTYSYDVGKDTEWNNKFVEDFQEAYDYRPSGTGAKLYWYMWILKEVFERAGEEYPDDPLNPKNLKKIMDDIRITEGPAVQVYPGPDPVLAFDENGDAVEPNMVGWQVIDGDSYVVWPFESAERDAVYPRPDYQGE